MAVKRFDEPLPAGIVGTELAELCQHIVTERFKDILVWMLKWHLVGVAVGYPHKPQPPHKLLDTTRIINPEEHARFSPAEMIEERHLWAGYILPRHDVELRPADPCSVRLLP
jgi:hypothetical protein